MVGFTQTILILAAILQAIGMMIIVGKSIRDSQRAEEYDTEKTKNNDQF